MEYSKDITGYGRKMGRDAGLNSEGRLESVVKLGGSGEAFDGMQKEGTVAARTINPGGSEAGGGSGLSGDYAPTEGRTDGIIVNPRL